MVCYGVACILVTWRKLHKCFLCCPWSSWQCGLWNVKVEVVACLFFFFFNSGAASSYCELISEMEADTGSVLQCPSPCPVAAIPADNAAWWISCSLVEQIVGEQLTLSPEEDLAAPSPPACSLAQDVVSHWHWVSGPTVHGRPSASYGSERHRSFQYWPICGDSVETNCNSFKSSCVTLFCPFWEFACPHYEVWWMVFLIWTEFKHLQNSFWYFLFLRRQCKNELQSFPSSPLPFSVFLRPADRNVMLRFRKEHRALNFCRQCHGICSAPSCVQVLVPDLLVQEWRSLSLRACRGPWAFLTKAQKEHMST